MLCSKIKVAQSRIKSNLTETLNKKKRRPTDCKNGVNATANNATASMSSTEEGSSCYSTTEEDNVSENEGENVEGGAGGSSGYATMPLSGKGSSVDLTSVSIEKPEAFDLDSSTSTIQPAREVKSSAYYDLRDNCNVLFGSDFYILC